MATMMRQFIYNKVPFKCNDYFECSSKVSTYITHNLAEKKKFLTRFKNSRTLRFIK